MLRSSKDWQLAMAPAVELVGEVGVRHHLWVLCPEGVHHACIYVACAEAVTLFDSETCTAQVGLWGVDVYLLQEKQADVSK